MEWLSFEPLSKPRIGGLGGMLMLASAAATATSESPADESPKISKCRTTQPHRFTLIPHHQMPGWFKQPPGGKVFTVHAPPSPLALFPAF